MWRYFLPIAFFILLVGFFLRGLSLDPSEIPSPLLGKPAPVDLSPMIIRKGSLHGWVLDEVSKVGEEQLFYLMSRGLSEEEATTMVVSGFIEPLVKELPMEYAVEMNRLIQLQMEGSIG